MISEKIELLGKGLYKSIPNELTLSSMPTISELEYVSSEDFEATMLDKILPRAVEEKVNFRELLEIDFYWICRCLRLLNYGPYHTTNAIFCQKCGMNYGEYRVDLRTIECKPLPENFENDIEVKQDEFIDFEGDVHIKLLTIQETMMAYKDKTFLAPDGKINRELARLCYMIKSIGNKNNFTPFEVKSYIQNNLSAADYRVLKTRVNELTDYGLRAGGSTVCPKCGNKNAAYYALVDDRFFSATLDDLRKWKHDRSERAAKDLSGSKKAAVREHN